jgi:hypothetical protein
MVTEIEINERKIREGGEYKILEDEKVLWLQTWIWRAYNEDGSLVDSNVVGFKTLDECKAEVEEKYPGVPVRGLSDGD